MKYDAIIIGSGQAANPLARALTAKGQSVAMIEKAKLGGTCVNTGCTPTKSMVACAQVAYYARNSTRWGIHVGETTVDLAAIVKRKAEIVGKSVASLEKSAADNKQLRLYRGEGQFTGTKKVEVNGDTLESEQFFLDTGTSTTIPPIDGLSGVSYLTNETLMELTEVPEHLLILGGGYIGLEFGQMFRRFGSKVTVVQRGEQLLANEDADVAGEMVKILREEGIDILLQTDCRAVQQQGKNITLSLSSSSGTSEVSGTHLLVATGREPNTKKLGLEKTGVATDDKGYIKVNDRLETNVPGIWAAGDVKGGPAFTHISYNDYQIIAANLLEGKRASTNDRLIPYAVFTDPQLGRVGLTEKAAREKGHKLKVGKVPMTRVARAFERGETAGFMKLVVDATNDQILGASIFASEGGETVQILSTLMLARQPYTLLKGAIYIHPTLAEGFYALMDSVELSA